MTVEVDRRYAAAKARIRNKGREELLNQFRSVYGERGEAMLARLTSVAPKPSAAAAPASPTRRSRSTLVDD